MFTILVDTFITKHKVPAEAAGNVNKILAKVRFDEMVTMKIQRINIAIIVSSGREHKCLYSILGQVHLIIMETPQ